MMQLASGNACPPVASDDIPPVAANVAPAITTNVVAHGAATAVPLIAANVEAHAARNATTCVAADIAGAVEASETQMDKGKRPMIDMDEEIYGTEDEGDEQVNLSPDDIHFILNRMFETRKRYIIETIRGGKKN
jgi:hypothetical protein